MQAAAFLLPLGSERVAQDSDHTTAGMVLRWTLMPVLYKGTKTRVADLDTAEEVASAQECVMPARVMKRILLGRCLQTRTHWAVP
jgi:hypothetical protein